MSDASDSPEAAPDSPLGSSPAENGVTREESAPLSSDDDAPPKKSKPKEDDNDDVDDDDAALFGEDSGEDEETRPKRTLDDEELDSGDEVGRRDRLEDSEPEVEERVINTVDISLGRHGIPQGSDGEIYLLRNAQSTGIEPRMFNPKSFKPPISSHHGASTLKGFSAAQTANTTIRWRRDPDDPKKLQSNSRIIRWSDGSLTLQIGSSPLEQLELPTVPLAPPQQHPRIPKPTLTNKANGAGYDSKMDAHIYLASVHQDAQFIRLTNHVTANLTVQTNVEADDEALIRLQENMAAASKHYARADQDSGPVLVKNLEDPELAKKKAEAAEKEKLRAEKRRLNQEQRMRERQDRVYGRGSGRAGYGAGGLTVGGLEDDGLGRPRPKAPRKPRRRGSEYSDDEDDFRRGKTREDEYDEDDGFLVGSDEEPEIVEDDDDEEEVLDENADAAGDEDMPAPPPKSPKRPREEDAEDGGGGGGGKRGRRMVLEDDEEDE